jgi:ABC-2 type transport system permease protein
VTGQPTATAIEPAARYRDLLAAEWIKMWSLRSTRWVLALSALAITAINVNAAAADYRNYPRYGPKIREMFDPSWALRDAFTDNAVLLLILTASTLGALAVTSEYSTGLIRTTFAAVARRRAVVAAKAIMLATVFLGYGALVSTVSFGLTQAILSRRGVGLSIGEPGVARAVAASTVLAPVCALVGLGIATLIRHTATTIAATLFGLVLLPLFFDDHRRLTATVNHALALNAWQRLTFPGHYLDQHHYPATITGAWITLAAWALGATALAVVAAGYRDV